MKIFGNYGFMATAAALILVLSSFLVTVELLAVEYASTASGVDVHLLTHDQEIISHQSFSAHIFITNDGTPLNAMEAEVYFDPAQVQVDAFTFGSELCEERFVIDNVIDNTAGRLHMSCGTVTPLTGTASLFGSLTATALTTGTVELVFGEKTHVYVHDGKGTEVVKDTYNLAMTVTTDEV